MVPNRTLAGLAIAASLLTASRALPQTAQVVDWTDLVGAAVANGVLRKTTGCDGCAGGARSVQTIDRGGGHIEFTPVGGSHLFAGLGTQQTASTSYNEIEFAFGLWPDGGWDIRESGMYRAEGRFAAGDRFKVSVASGAVQYYQNGALVFSSAAGPVYPLVFDATLLGASAAIGGATLVKAATVSSTSAAPNPGPYDAIVDRVARAKPATAAPSAAGGRFTDVVFGSRMLRVTDQNTRPGAWSLSYRSPSGSHQNAWSSRGRYFYVVSTDGAVVPFAFDPASMTASRINASTGGDGGLMLQLGGEPEFSFFDDSSLYGVYTGAGANLRTLAAYDLARNTYTPLLNLDTVVAGLAGTYVGGLSASHGAVEKISAFFGGSSQGQHHYVVVFDRWNPAVRHVVDTLASTVDGTPANIPLNFRLHHSFMDKSGQYVMLYPPGMDQQAPRKASPGYLWNLATNQFTELPLLAGRVSGHDGIGFGYITNQDCCTRSTWDAAQWQIRSFAAPFTIADLIGPMLMPKEVMLADHQSWANAEQGRLVPIISATYRYGLNTSEWRAWDDEIIAVQTDVALSAQGGMVWRFAHHRSNVANDNDPGTLSFWYTPRAIVSQDGRWAIFTSNWDKTLGTDSRGQPGTMFRQDVFVVELKMLASGGAIPPSPQGIRFVP